MLKTRRAFTLIELMVVVAIVGILIAITIPATSKALNRARNIQCTGNLKQLSAAMLLYCKDNQGKFPVLLNTATTNQWGTTIARYLRGKAYENGLDPKSPAKERAVFFCPNALKHHPGDYPGKHGSYAMNSEFMENRVDAGPARRISNFNRTSTTVMLADGRRDMQGWWDAGLNWKTGWYPDDYPDKPTDGRSTFVHENGANFVFLDGHTEWLEYSNYSAASNEWMWTGEAPQ